MTAWLVYAAEYVPVCAVVSLICAAMKEDDLGPILLRGTRIFGAITALTVVFSLVIWGVILILL